MLNTVLQDRGLCEEALDMVVAEDVRQIEIWGCQKHDVYKWLAIALEEHGELAKALLEGDLKGAQDEAVQLAAVALKMGWMIKKLRNDMTERVVSAMAELRKPSEKVLGGEE